MVLEFSIEIYALQLGAGRHFLHEHPAGTSSWASPSMKKLLAHPMVQEQPATSPTRFASSASEILRRLEKRCGRHLKQHRLVGGQRLPSAASYPPGMSRAVLQGMEAQSARAGKAIPIGTVRALIRGSGISS